MTLIDPCASGWIREANGDFVPLWFIGAQFPDELEKQKTAGRPTNNEDEASPPTQHEPQPPAESSCPKRPQRFSALVARYAMKDSADLSDSEEGESECSSDSDSISNSSGDDSDDDDVFI